MAKQKARRMFPRAERRAATAARAAIPPPTLAQRDETLLLGEDSAGRLAHSPQMLADTWLALHNEPEREPYETTLMRAAARQFHRLTGVLIDEDTAETFIEPDYEELL